MTPHKARQVEPTRRDKPLQHLNTYSGRLPCLWKWLKSSKHTAPIRVTYSYSFSFKHQRIILFYFDFHLESWLIVIAHIVNCYTISLFFPSSHCLLPPLGNYFAPTSRQLNVCRTQFFSALAHWSPKVLGFRIDSLLSATRPLLFVLTHYLVVIMWPVL